VNEYKSIPVADLIPYASNSRTHDDAQIAQIAASIKEFGFTNPVLVDPDNGIIAGHGRVLAARKLNRSEVPCIILEGLTDAQRKAYIIADNQLPLNAGWDMEMLSVEIEGLADADFDLSLLGFDDDFLAEITADEGTEGLTDEDEVPEVPEEPKTVLGDVWLLGNHRLMCGDSTSIDAVEKLMDGQKADMVFTSPPYNVGMKYSGHDDKMENSAYMKMIAAIISNCYLIMKDGVLIGWNVGVSPKSKPYAHAVALEDAGFDLFRHIVWKKTGASFPLWQNSKKKPLARNYMPNYNHEMIYMMKKGDITTGARTSMPDELSMDVWDVSQFSAGGNNHPAAFPVKLAEAAIMVMSCSNEIYFEPFGGSGTACIACEKTGRNSRIMELDPKYCDVIITRWQNFTGQKATHEETGLPFGSAQEVA